MIDEKTLAIAEEAIINLSESMNITEQNLLTILRNGLEFESSFNQLSKSDEFFLSEMEATFGN